MKSKHAFSLLLAAAVLSSALIASPALAGARVYVRVGPPPVRVEVRGVAPGPSHVWIGGYHRWDGGAYVWVPGRWELPRHPHAVWVPGHWRHTRHGWYWIEGHWR